MTDTVDLLIRARFDGVANSSDDRDWDDVLARAGLSSKPTANRSVRRTTFRRRVPTRVALVAAVVVLAAVLTAVAFGWPHRFIDFVTSPPAPTKIKKWFEYDNVTAPPGMNPQAISGEARKIMTARFDESGGPTNHPSPHTLYVAPRKGGGFCYLWTNADGGCAPVKNPATTAESRAAGPLGLTWFGTDYPLVADGFVRTGATQTVEARFADGATATIPVTWISAPINAGFFVYPAPTAHQNRADALQSVVALDANGNVIGRESFPLTRRNWPPKFVTQTLPDGTRVLLPRDADLAKAREIFSFRATDGSHVYLWVVPLTGGGSCNVNNQGEGCGPSVPVFSGGLYGGGNRILFVGQSKPDVATIELRYQNGQSERLTPIDGFVVHDITSAHYKRGTRLVDAVALDRSGNAILTQRFQPRDRIYPCKKPINRGHGVKTCP
jgi:hypothetical protein